MGNQYDGTRGNGYQPIGGSAPKPPPTTEYRYSANWQPIPLSMVIIGAISIGFVLGCAI
jgi:hypothetical protein